MSKAKRFTVEMAAELLDTAFRDLGADDLLVRCVNQRVRVTGPKACAELPRRLFRVHSVDRLVAFAERVAVDCGGLPSPEIPFDAKFAIVGPDGFGSQL